MKKKIIQFSRFYVFLINILSREIVSTFLTNHTHTYLLFSKKKIKKKKGRERQRRFINFNAQVRSLNIFLKPGKNTGLVNSTIQDLGAFFFFFFLLICT